MMRKKTIVISGGLGNQLFQFSFAHYLAKNFHAKLSFTHLEQKTAAANSSCSLSVPIVRMLVM